MAPPGSISQGFRLSYTQTESSIPLVRKVLTKFTTMAILTIWCLVTGNMTGKNMIDSHRNLGYISNYWLVKVFNLNVTEKVMMKNLAKFKIHSDLSNTSKSLTHSCQ